MDFCMYDISDLEILIYIDKIALTFILYLQVLNIMKLELAASGLTEEEILVKAQLLMKAFGKVRKKCF